MAGFKDCNHSIYIEYFEMHTNASAILGPNQKNIVKWVKKGEICVFVRLNLAFWGVYVAANQLPSAGIEFKHQVKNTVIGNHHEHMSSTFSFPSPACIFNAIVRSIPNKVERCYIPLGVKKCSNFNLIHRYYSVNNQLIASMFVLRIVLCLPTDPLSKLFAMLIHQLQY